MKRVIAYSLLFLCFHTAVSQKSKLNSRISEVNHWVDFINTSTYSDTSSFGSDNFRMTYYKTQYCVNTVMTDLIKIIDERGTEGETLVSTTHYYFLDKDLLKVDETIVPPSGGIKVHTEYYYYKNRPLYPFGKQSKYIQKEFLEKAKSAFAIFNLPEPIKQ